MTKKYPSEFDDLIRSLWYQGVPRQEIERQTGASAGHISDVIAEEKRLIGEGNVDAMRRLAGEAGKHSFNPLAISRAIRFLNACNTLGMDDEEIIDSLPRIDEACKKAGIEIKDLPLDVEGKAEKLKSLEAKIQTSEEIAFEADKRREAALLKAKQTDESLAECQQMRNFLEDHGMPADNPKKMENLFRNAEQAGFDVKSLAAKVAAVDSLDERIKEGDGIIKMQQEQQAGNKKILDQQLVQIKASEVLITEMNNFKSVGGTPSLLKEITNTAKKVAASNRMTDQQGMEKLAIDILTKYDPMKGFEKAAAEEEKKAADAAKKFEEFKTHHARYIGLMEALNDIFAGGGTSADILAIKSILEKDGTNLPAFRAQVLMHGSTSKLLDDIEEQVKKGEARRIELERVNSTLEARSAALEKTYTDYDERLRKVMQTIVDAASSGAMLITDTSKQASANLVDAARIGIRGFDVIDAQAKEVIKRYTRTLGIGVFEPLIRYVNGEEVDPKQIREAALFAMQILLTFLSLGSPNRSALERVMKDLKGDFTFGVF